MEFNQFLKCSTCENRGPDWVSPAALVISHSFGWRQVGNVHNSCVNQVCLMLDFPLLLICHPVSPSSFEVPRSFFAVPEGFCLADKTRVRGSVDPITLILCPCRDQVGETTSIAVHSPGGCQFPLHSSWCRKTSGH